MTSLRADMMRNPDYGNAAISGFGGADAFKLNQNIIFAPGKRRRINAVPIVLNVFGPSAMFNAVFLVLSFKAHYRSEELTWTFVLFAFAVVFCMIWYARRTRKSLDREGDWYTFASYACLIAVILATISGALNYEYHLRPYYLQSNLNTYASVNPASEWGQQFMDAGKVYFADGSGLDMKKAASFKNSDLYCVVPIVNGDEKLDHYDFWAVGTNCCNPDSSDFRCGQFNNPFARSGLRVFWPYDLSYYRLAVQDAEVTYGVSSPHPLFFYWVQDPVAEINQLSQRGLRVFYICTICHFSLSLASVMFTTVFFSKLGYLSTSAGETHGLQI
mmetsp:Transcript_28084/g.43886  ORF Transcript_28084/g.43886 Transcript_28084/m.43886 type:complete len:330 (-) Transcript_28084:51-1040(-)